MTDDRARGGFDEEGIHALEVLTGIDRLGSDDALQRARLDPVVAAGLRAALERLLDDAPARRPLVIRGDDAALEVRLDLVDASGLALAGDVLEGVGASLGPADDRAGAWVVRAPLLAGRDTYLMLEQGTLRLAVPWHAVARVRMIPTDSIDAVARRHHCSVLQPFAADGRAAPERPVITVVLGLRRAFLLADRLVWRLQGESVPHEDAPGVALSRAVQTVDGEIYWVVEPEALLAGIDPMPLPEVAPHRPFEAERRAAELAAAAEAAEEIAAAERVAAEVAAAAQAGGGPQAPVAADVDAGFDRAGDEASPPARFRLVLIELGADDVEPLDDAAAGAATDEAAAPPPERWSPALVATIETMETMETIDTIDSMEDLEALETAETMGTREEIERAVEIALDPVVAIPQDLAAADVTPLEPEAGETTPVKTTPEPLVEPEAVSVPIDSPETVPVTIAPPEIAPPESTRPEFAPDAAAPPVPAPPAPAFARRALIAEDSITARIFLERMLDRRGWEVVAVRSARELDRELGRGGVFAALFVDVDLPDARGAEHLRAHVAAEASGAPPVVALVRDRADEGRAAAEGVVRTLRKPFEIEDLDRLLQGLEAEARR